MRSISEDSVLTVMVLALMGAVVMAAMPQRSAADGPIGRYRLASVDGSKVPMVWDQAETHEGGRLQMSWVSGRAEFRADGSFTLSFSTKMGGPGLGGAPTSKTATGVWRWASGGQIELLFDGGQRTYWSATDGFARLMLNTSYVDLDGERRIAMMVLIRE